MAGHKRVDTRIACRRAKARGRKGRARRAAAMGQKGPGEAQGSGEAQGDTQGDTLHDIEATMRATLRSTLRATLGRGEGSDCIEDDGSGEAEGSDDAIECKAKGKGLSDYNTQNYGKAKGKGKRVMTPLLRCHHEAAKSSEEAMWLKSIVLSGPLVGCGWTSCIARYCGAVVLGICASGDCFRCCMGNCKHQQIKREILFPQHVPFNC